MKDFKIKLLEKKLICENTYQFTFDKPENGYEYFPGQYALFTLPDISTGNVFNDDEKDKK